MLSRILSDNLTDIYSSSLSGRDCDVLSGILLVYSLIFPSGSLTDIQSAILCILSGLAKGGRTTLIKSRAPARWWKTLRQPATRKTEGMCVGISYLFFNAVYMWGFAVSYVLVCAILCSNSSVHGRLQDWHFFVWLGWCGRFCHFVSCNKVSPRLVIHEFLTLLNKTHWRILKNVKCRFLGAGFSWSTFLLCSAGCGWSLQGHRFIHVCNFKRCSEQILLPRTWRVFGPRPKQPFCVFQELFGWKQRAKNK